MEHGSDNKEEDMNATAYGCEPTMRSRQSSMSCDTNTSGSSSNSDPYKYLNDDDSVKMANPHEAIPLHWKSIPMPWK